MAPSLRRGQGSASELASNLTELSSIDRDSFTRVFDLAALRVPAAGCPELSRRLRGHLLNWPRIRNLARVDGDEMDHSSIGLGTRLGTREAPTLSPPQ
jgi:tRNA (guanine37-N1)-methyltransferase